MPCDYRQYHPQWKSIARQIRDQANNECEQCGVKNGAYGARDCRGRWHDQSSIDGMNSTEGDMLWPDGYPEMIRIVLTVHHRCDCDKRECHDPIHLQALCQRCHLNADRPHHLAVQAANRIARKETDRYARGVRRLFE